jgi:hypothetical protein
MSFCSDSSFLLVAARNKRTSFANEDVICSVHVT